MSDELKTFIGEKVGEATMCWEPIPSGVFKSERAVKILEEIEEAVQAEITQALTAYKKELLSKVDRFEVIDSSGRAYTKSPVKVSLEYQDGGKTLKVFVQNVNQNTVNDNNNVK